MATFKGGKPGLLSKPPPPPSDLWGYGEEVWRRTCAYLVAEGRLHSGDLPTVLAYCQSVARAYRIERELEQQDLRDEFGKLNPLLPAVNSTVSNITKLASLLGVAPAPRSRLKSSAGDKPAEDAWDKLL